MCWGTKCIVDHFWPLIGWWNGHSVIWKHMAKSMQRCKFRQRKWCNVITQNSHHSHIEVNWKYSNYLICIIEKINIRLNADRQLLCRGNLEGEGEGRAGASGTTLDSTLIWSHLPAGEELRVYKLLGLKSGFIFTLASQPLCSSEPPRRRPPQSGVCNYSLCPC